MKRWSAFLLVARAFSELEESDVASAVIVEMLLPEVVQGVRPADDDDLAWLTILRICLDS